MGAYAPSLRGIRIPTGTEKSGGAPCTCGRLRRASRALTQLYDDAMAAAGLRVTQFSLLRALAREGPLRISDLAARQLLDRTALSRNLDPLVAAGYVGIARGRDARTREVAITPKGAAALDAAQPHWLSAQRKVANRLGTEKLEALVAVLGELESLHPAAAAAPSPRPSPASGRGSAPASPQPSPASGRGSTLASTQPSPASGRRSKAGSRR